MIMLLYAWHRTGGPEASLHGLIAVGQGPERGLPAFGLDYKIWGIYYVNQGGWHRLGEVMAAETLFIVFLASNIVIYYWPSLSPQILGQRQELPGLPTRRGC